MRACPIRIESGTLDGAWWGPAPAEAPTLVLLHEGLGSVALWREVPQRLSAATGWGVFAYSRFGYGNSDPCPMPRPMDYLHHEAERVLPAVLQAAGIGQAVLVGHSDGGSIAAIYAASCAARPAHQPPATQPAGAPVLAADGLSAPGSTGPKLRGLITIAAHFIVEELNLVSIRQIRTEYQTGALRQRLARHHRDVDMAFWGWNDAWLDRRFRDFDITRLLPRIDVPILAMQGDDDPYGTDEQLRILQAGVHTSITTRLIAGARHAPHLDARDATLAAITDFVTTLPPRCSQSPAP